MNNNLDNKNQDIIIQQVSLDSNDQELIEVEQCFNNRNAYFVQRPGPVYTIPEREEEETIINTESIYHAREFERRSLHGIIVPTLASNIVRYTKSQRDQLQDNTVCVYSQEYLKQQKQYQNIISSTNNEGKEYILASNNNINNILISNEFSFQQNQIIPIQSVSLPQNNVQNIPSTLYQKVFLSNIIKPNDLLLSNHYQSNKIHHDQVVENIVNNKEQSITNINEISSANYSSSLLNEEKTLNLAKLKRSPAMILKPNNECEKNKINENHQSKYSTNINLEDTLLPLNEDTSIQQNILTTIGRRKLPLLPSEYFPTAATSITHKIDLTDSTKSFFLAKNLQSDINFLLNDNKKSSFLLIPESKTNIKTQNIVVESNKTAFDKLNLNNFCENSTNLKLQNNSLSNLSPMITFSSTNLSFLTENFPLNNLQTTLSLTLRRENYLSNLKNTQPLIQKKYQQPTIIPGATFKKITTTASFLPNIFFAVESKQPTHQFLLTKRNLKENLLFNNQSDSSLIGNKASNETLSQLAFKKELRETLNQIRTSSQVACEIEANHRYHIITQMLKTGIIPDILRRRQTETNLETPNVIKCMLPYELIKDVKIISSCNKKNNKNCFGIQNNYFVVSKNQNNNNNINKFIYNNYLLSNKQIINTNSAQNQSLKFNLTVEKRSVGCQYDTKITEKKNFESIQFQKQEMQYIVPVVPLKNQLKTNHNLLQQKNPLQFIDSKTQTIENNKKIFNDKSLKNVTSNLINYKQDFFDIHDLSKKLKKKLKYQNRFKFTELNNQYDIEIKQHQIQLELEQLRHEKNISMIDLRYLKELNATTDNTYLNNADISNLSPTTSIPNQFYNSLPHIYDHFHQQKLPRVIEKYQNYNSNQNNIFQNKNNYNYGSLPRNYERLCAENNLNNFEFYYQQQNQNLLTNKNLDYSLSMQNLNKYNNTKQNFDLNDLKIKQQIKPKNSQFYKSTSSINNLNLITTTANDLYLREQPQLIKPSLQAVYSRYESNYGQRPSTINMRDYGNYLHNQAQNLQQLDNLKNLICYENLNKWNQKLLNNCKFSNSTSFNDYQTMSNLFIKKKKTPKTFNHFDYKTLKNLNKTYHILPQQQQQNCICYPINYSCQNPSPFYLNNCSNLKFDKKTEKINCQKKHSDDLNRIMQQYSKNSCENFRRNNLMSNYPVKQSK